MNRPDEAPPGFLLVAKPPGPSSRKIVDAVVRLVGTRRVGHAGTLDPFAGGLLLVLWGRTTALVPYMVDYPKRYLATVRFGSTTDTQDRTGTVLEERDPSKLTPSAVEAALPRFRGSILQAPPAFSAARRGGTRLYQLARRGVLTEAEPKERVIHRFELLEWDPPRARFDVHCSKGTYVRSLAHDLGNVLGVGAHLEALTRTGIGPFSLEDAVPADRLEGLGSEGLRERALPPAAALPDWPPVILDAEESWAVLHGSWLDPDGILSEPGRYRLLDASGNLLALAQGAPMRLLRVVSGDAG